MVPGGHLLRWKTTKLVKLERVSENTFVAYKRLCKQLVSERMLMMLIFSRYKVNHVHHLSLEYKHSDTCYLAQNTR